MSDEYASSRERGRSGGCDARAAPTDNGGTRGAEMAAQLSGPRPEVALGSETVCAHVEIRR
jgi:hypothetical protein